MFLFSRQLLSETFSLLTRNLRLILNVYISSRKIAVILVRFTSNLNFLDGFSTKFSNIRLSENRCSGIWVVPSGQTDGTKPIVSFQNFANALIIRNFRILTCTQPDCLICKKEAKEKVLVKYTSNATLIILFFNCGKPFLNPLRSVSLAALKQQAEGDCTEASVQSGPTYVCRWHTSAYCELLRQGTLIKKWRDYLSHPIINGLVEHHSVFC